MNKTTLTLTIAFLIIASVFVTLIITKSNESSRLKEQNEFFAKENESLKMDNEMLKKKLEDSNNAGARNSFQDLSAMKQKLNIMKSEVARLRAENKPQEAEEYKEREELIWDSALSDVKKFVDIELTKRLASFGFKPEDVSFSVEEYKTALDRSKDLLLQLYRNEISDDEYSDRIMDLNREMFDHVSDSASPQIASVLISIVLPDIEFRKKMFEEK